MQLFFSKLEIRKKIGSNYFSPNLAKIVGGIYFSPKFGSLFAHLHCKTILFLHLFSQKTRFGGLLFFAKSYVLDFFREQLFFAKSQNLSSGATIVRFFNYLVIKMYTVPARLNGNLFLHHQPLFWRQKYHFVENPF